MSASLSPLLPKEDAREAALFFVVCALCFLAALSGLVSRSAYAAADAWTDEVTGQITIRVRGDEAALGQAVEITQATPGIASARPITRGEAEELLQPWLGAGGVPVSLPLPKLIAAEAASTANASAVIDALKKSLGAAGLDTIVDDHLVWSGDVRKAIDLAGLVALIAVGLLGATGLAVIAFATHATLLARRDIVELLHLSGARDTYIAGLFERRFLMLGVQAGALGALLAFGGAAFILYLLRQSDAQIWLLPQLSLSLADGLILGTSPLIAGVASMIAARVTVMRSLSDMV
ncbi:MAG: cell division protein FtsX [Hyphomonadaceae bacterium]